MSADEKKRVAVLLASSRARQLVPELFQQMGLQVEILTAPAELGPAWQSAQHDLLVVDIDMQPHLLKQLPVSYTHLTLPTIYSV